jgi:hypothetical protein
MQRSAIVVALFVAGLTVTAACGSSKDSAFGDANGSSGSSGSASGGFVVGTDGGPSGGCVGLQCQVHSCAGGGTTNISGKVYDPAGKNPLYNVVVYVPNAPVDPLPSGASCDKCDALYTGSPIVSALTDASGAFTLKGVPDGANVPIVIQVGKWRRQLTLPNVTQCQDNAQPDKLLRLPSNTSEGDIPNIAISTGGADTLECLLRRVGLDAKEYGGGAAGTGRIHIFQGDQGPNTSPGGPASSTGLWASKADLAKYDIVLLSCEGAETTSMNQQALVDYAAMGGRVFASHFHYSWFNSGPYAKDNLATWTAGTNDLGNITASIITTLPGGGPFAKGQALEQWLTNVGALSGGRLSITAARHNADVTAAHTSSQAWIKAESGKSVGATEYFTFNTPVGTAPADQCGRVVYSDLHVGAASGDYGGLSTTTPDGCSTADLSAQEKALEFMLFDLSSCVTPDNQPPPPPPGVK